MLKLRVMKDYGMFWKLLEVYYGCSIGGVMWSDRKWRSGLV